MSQCELQGVKEILFANRVDAHRPELVKWGRGFAHEVNIFHNAAIQDRFRPAETVAVLDKGVQKTVGGSVVALASLTHDTGNRAEEEKEIQGRGI